MPGYFIVYKVLIVNATSKMYQRKQEDISIKRIQLIEEENNFESVSTEDKWIQH